MQIHFCESCGQQFSSEGNLPPGAALCNDCHEKQGSAPAPRPGRTNTLLRASTARGSHRQRSGSHPVPPTRGKAGLPASIVWGGILALAVMIGLLLFAFQQVNVGDRKRIETIHPPEVEQPTVTAPTTETSGTKPDSRAAEVAFEELLVALKALPEGDRAARLAKLDDFINQYPESIQSSRARTMASTLRDSTKR